MKAIITTRYGSPDDLKLQEVEKPRPKDDELLIRVRAATVTAGDVMLRSLPFPVWLLLRLFMGLKRKRTPGHEFSGEVEAIGKDVTRFRKGDQVFGTTTGLSAGANAEYLCLPQEWKGGVLAHKPANLTHEQAAAVPVGAMTALYLLQKGNIESGQDVLIYGASGSVGTYAVQLAASFGAHVTGICSTRNVDLVKSLGAEKVVDYTKDDFTESGETYDLVFDAVGKASPSAGKRVLAENGAYVSVRSTTGESLANLNTIKALIEAGKISPVIDRSFPLEQTAEAHRYVETGHKIGNVVITF